MTGSAVTSDGDIQREAGIGRSFFQLPCCRMAGRLTLELYSDSTVWNSVQADEMGEFLRG